MADMVGLLERAVSKKQRLVDNAKIAETALKKNPELLKGIMSLDDFNALDAKTKVLTFMGAVHGEFEALKRQQAQARLQSELGALESLKEETRARRRSNDAAEAFASEMQGPVEMDEDAVVERGVRSGLSPQDLSLLRGAVEGIGPNAARPGTVQEVPGLEGYVYGVQNRAGAGTFIPKRVGGGGSGRSPAQEAVDQARADYYRGATDRAVIEGKSRELSKIYDQIFETQKQLNMADPGRSAQKYQALRNSLKTLRGTRDALENEIEAIRTGGGKRETATAESNAAPVSEEAKAKAEQIRAAFRAGRMSREQALSELRKLGFK